MKKVLILLTISLQIILANQETTASQITGAEGSIFSSLCPAGYTLSGSNCPSCKNQMMYDGNVCCLTSECFGTKSR